MLKRGITIALAAGALVTVGFMLYAGELSDSSWWLGFAIFGLWALTPYLAVAYLTHKFSASQRSLWVLQIAALLMALGSAVLLYTSLIAQPDAQSGIAFLALPVFLFVGLVPFLGVAFLLRDREPNL